MRDNTHVYMNAKHDEGGSMSTDRATITYPLTEGVVILPGDEVILYSPPCCEGPCSHEADRDPEPPVRVLAVNRHPNNPTWVESYTVQEADGHDREVKPGAICMWVYPANHVF